MTRSRENADHYGLADDAVTLAKMAHGADGSLITYSASTVPELVAPGTTGHVLTSRGNASTPTFQAAAGGGITHASEWHLTSNHTGDAAPLTGSLAALGGSIGGAMTHSSGLFTFPDEGIWEIRCSWMFYIATSTDRSCGIAIEVSKNGGSYAEVAFGSNGISNTGSGTQFSHAGAQYIFDVIDKSDYNVRFSVDVVNTSVISYGHASSGRCSITFVRLGDT